MNSNAVPSVGFESRIRRYIHRLGLLPVAFVVWRTIRELSPALIQRNRRARLLVKNTAPIPPNSLIFSSTGTRNVEWFLESGALTEASFRRALSDQGRPLESFESALDFGCGAGRMIRRWESVTGPRFSGCDYNAPAIQWNRTHLGFAQFQKNELRPPLPFVARSFDLCYAISVFTHLPKDLQRPWIEELHRVLKPEAILLLTLSGRGDFKRLTESDRRIFESGELVVLDPEFAGTNLCGVYHPEEFVRREWSDLFELVKRYPEGAKGSPNQDLFVFRRIA